MGLMVMKHLLEDIYFFQFLVNKIHIGLKIELRYKILSRFSVFQPLIFQLIQRLKKEEFEFRWLEKKIFLYRIKFNINVIRFS